MTEEGKEFPSLSVDLLLFHLSSCGDKVTNITSTKYKIIPSAKNDNYGRNE